MCGRAHLSSDVSEIKLVFSIPPHRPTPNFPPSWNVAPTDPLPVVRYDRKAGERSLDLLRWGLPPFWARDINSHWGVSLSFRRSDKSCLSAKKSISFCDFPKIGSDWNLKGNISVYDRPKAVYPHPGCPYQPS